MRQISSVLLGLLALLIVQTPAAQTTYPERPIRLVVPLAPGIAADTIARLFGQVLAEALGKPVIIDNVTGAAGNNAADRVSKAAPDGYTLGLLGQSQIVINPSLYKLAYDPVKDFEPISQVLMLMDILLVHNAVPAKSVKELVALAKAQPGVITFASTGSRSRSYMVAELFKSMAGIDIRHIPHQGGSAAMRGLLGGHAMMTFIGIGIGLPVAREGKLRALAVTSLRRTPAALGLPTIAEFGYPGFESTSWYGLLAPAGTPATIVRKLHLETIKAVARPDLRAKVAEFGMEGIGNSPEEFAVLIKSGIPRWAKVDTGSGTRPD